MGIFEELNERRALRSVEIDYDDSVKDAQKIFDSQVAHVRAIKNTSGFNEIVGYFEREKKSCENMILLAKNRENLREIQIKYEIIVNFIGFLTSRIDYVPESNPLSDDNV